MKEPEVPANESDRQAALDQLRILDTPPEARFDRLTRMAARLLDVPIALISLIDRDRQWFKSCVGLDVSETPRSISFCGHAILIGQPLLVEDASTDERFRDNPLVTGAPNIRFYAGTPLHSADGYALGTLCVIDRIPRKLSKEDLQCLRDIADCIEEQISARELAIHYREQELQKQNESLIMLKQLADLVPGGLYQFRLFPDGRMSFPFSSKGIERTFGVTPAQARDNAAALFEMVEPEDYTAVVDSIKESSQHLSTWSIQFRIRQPEGRIRWIEGHSTPQKLSDGSIIWHGYLEDIDEKKRALLGLEESEQQLRRLFELAPSGIILADYHTGEIINVNASMLKSTGYSKEEFLNLGYRQLLAPDHLSKQAEVLEQLQQRGYFGPLEQEVVDRYGNSYPAIVHAMLILDSAGRKLLWVLLEDISERKKIERMKNQFVSTVSHELRTPLTSITGAIGLLAGGATGMLPQKAQDMMDIAQRNAKQLARLIDDLLDIEKLVTGKLNISMHRQPLLPLLEQAVSENQAYGIQRAITVHLAPDTPKTEIFVDGQRLLQGLNNLISNAIKFSPDKGRVDVSAQQQILEGSPTVTISVKDSGEGVPEAFRSSIFQRFAQADSSDTRSQGGTGLGLAITRELITIMGGEVGFESLPGQGATFWIRLPVSVNGKL
ncbi:ATP-binding protein [Marinobacter sp. DY40_1A1]|uniref:ATP-binding protein n=1 Tax=Marinobacter sp. DY40_1A1 TaxID=2583229 RepID=UPI001904ACAC|nr:ATP-binding protein [Marinobacter sp. DY40_1A1]MBK1886470.1 PAS domain S-box protein [Marinobacter sp. DY40_1A1]